MKKYFSAIALLFVMVIPSLGQSKAIKDVKDKSINLVNKMKDGLTAKRDDIGKKIVNGVNKTNDKVHDKIEAVVNTTK